MVLCLLNASRQLTELELLPEYHKTGDVWHMALEFSSDLNDWTYGWKADGPHGWEGTHSVPRQPLSFVLGGSCFHPETILLDPYSTWTTPITSAAISHTNEAVYLGTMGHQTSPDYDWQQTERPRASFERLVVSECDLTAFSAESILTDASKIIAQMSETGVNAVIFRGALLSEDINGDPCPLSFFSPNTQIFTSPNDLKTLIQECHEHSMEVLLEIHFGFTGDNASRMSLKGLDVRLYFRGKGILNCGHPVVQELILESLHHWAIEYRVDGFVFRHAETLTQDRDGIIQDAPALAEAIAVDPILRKCKLVAVSGDDQLLPRSGERGFPHWGCWTEYNSRFQFDFWDFIVNMTSNKLSNIATRMTGSGDLFAACWDGGYPGSLAAGRRPAFGFNSPVPAFQSLTQSMTHDILKPSRQSESCIRLLLMATVVSQGVPVIPFDCWSDPLLISFLKVLLAFRTEYLDLIQPDAFDAIRGIEWHGSDIGEQPEWDGGPKSHFIGYSIRDATGHGFYVGFNGYQTHMDIHMPEAQPGYTWRCLAHSVEQKTDEIIIPPLSVFHLSAQSAVIFECVLSAAKTGWMPEI